jgi:hypothetical protein
VFLLGAGCNPVYSQAAVSSEAAAFGIPFGTNTLTGGVMIAGESRTRS